MSNTLSCPFPTRPTRSSPGGRRKWDESDWAEQVAFLLFTEQFKERHGGGVFISQHGYRTQTIDDNPSAATLFEMMNVYFRNWVPPEAYKWDPGTRKEGGFRKPDGLGISPTYPDGQVFTELIEVKPVDKVSDGQQQLKDMLDKLRDGMRGWLDEERTVMSLDPGINESKFKFLGSPFIPSERHMGFPLTDLTNQTPAEVSWVCYRPTERLRRPLGQFSTPNPQNDGLILYEIHTLDLRQSAEGYRALPQQIRDGIREAYLQYRRARRSAEPRLVPWEADYLTREAEARKKLQAQLMVAGVALLVGIIILCILAPPAGAAAAGTFAGAAETVTGETVAEVVMEEAFVNYRVPAMVRVALPGEAVSEGEAVEAALDFARALRGGP
jgi:hypothetical protein